MKSDITVIVPMYNVEKYVKKCFESLENQTYSNFEVLAINDGSPDNSSKYAKECAAKDNRIKVIDKENGGYGSALELAINSIDSDYFLVCDPDDWLEEDCLEVLYTFAKNNDTDIVVGDRFDVYADDGSAHKCSVKPGYLESIEPKKVYSETQDIQLFSFFQVSPHAKLYKTQLLKNVSFPKHVSYTDFLLYLVALSRAKKVSYYDKALAFYLQDRPGNTATDIRNSIINDYLTVWKKTFEIINNNNVDNNVDFLMYRLYMQLRLILAEYKRVSINGFNNKYWDNIMSAVYELQNIGINTVPYFENSMIKKTFFKFFMNRKTANFAAKIYVTLKK